MKHSIPTIAVPLFVVTTLIACSNSDDGTPAPIADNTPQNITIDFDLYAGLSKIACNQTLPALGTSAAVGQLQDARIYLSDIKLIDSNDKEMGLTLTQDGKWQNGSSALLDFENATGLCAGTAETNTTVKGTIPAGTYTGIKFTVGLPETVNHLNPATAAAPFNVPQMDWGWQAGRKFTKIEVAANAENGTTPPVFMVHLGSTGCTADATNANGYVCTNANRGSFHSHSFNTSTQKIVLDLDTLLAASDIKVNQGGPKGCMSGKTDPECTAIFNKLQIDLNTGNVLDDHQQKLFRVATK